MSASDTLTILQTLIALFACVLLVWYIFATHKLQRQAQEESRLHREQLDIAKKELAQVLMREKLLFRPDLQWQAGASAPNEERWEFENLGADICNLRWYAPEGTKIECDPSQLIRTFDHGSIVIRGTTKLIGFPFRFSLAYNNRFGESCIQEFEIPAAGKLPEETRSG